MEENVEATEEVSEKFTSHFVFSTNETNSSITTNRTQEHNSNDDQNQEQANDRSWNQENVEVLLNHRLSFSSVTSGNKEYTSVKPDTFEKFPSQDIALAFLESVPYDVTEHQSSPDLMSKNVQPSIQSLSVTCPTSSHRLYSNESQSTVAGGDTSMLNLLGASESSKSEMRPLPLSDDRPAHPPPYVFFERDYIKGMSIQFESTYPEALRDWIPPNVVEQTLDGINEIMWRAEQTTKDTFIEGVLGCLSLYLIYLFKSSYYSK
eukprot:Ihof_evm1s255 gene=Ihof_evmTU1s255